ncbi:MAG: DNA-directed RNA polymerase subunit beta' [Phycisphaerae bacterium]|nr:DNA-directed RNA polymerase subunit beta' [Phycisphaerae bacterium]NIP53705.1 DNA-directed RNA polymerase subunit beta' [Phycisphaerae bacterium]NIS52628.1 DNA-directed RNA polymerase subunit beta' [Phycisphaerae bacterium]NIU10107.1 DNA-directed RNA polymerase subunit beta' [Phycisphaerae bacterium]NIV02701.1 DNA-directed RNA polymerase subunit beta' [Phycisphaerae bacterium]
MYESIYDRINDYGSVKISLASPNDIRSWSFGEVRKPETINYRTYRPEKDGLFCERIFGPERDWECACGKYKGTKFKGIICDRCGVKVTHSRVRRKRMGHINLAAPVVHIWFYKAIPNRIGTLLAMKTADLEKIIYFQDYVVTDPGHSPLKLGQLLSEEEFREASNKYGAPPAGFKASMGAEAIRALLMNLDLKALSVELRQAIIKTNSKQKIKDLTKRLKIVNEAKNSNNKAEWMVLEVIPVIPPDLRPLVLLERGNFATSDLNDLYRRIINRNNRLKKLIDLNAPDVIIRNEKRMLQQAVDSLLDNGRCRRPVLGSNNRPLKSLTDMIKGKQGRFRENLLGKRVDYSARSVIVVGPNLKLYQCGLPKKIALELYQPFIIRKLRSHGLADTIKSAKRMIERRDDPVWDVLEEVIHQHPVLLNRAPTLHRMGVQAFEPILVEGNAIMLHPLACKGFNADFDGDQMAVHLPLSVEAQAETHILMMATSNIFSPANGSPMVGPSQDMVMGNYYLTYMEKEYGRISEQPLEIPAFRDTYEAIMAHDVGTIRLHEKIKVKIDKSVISSDIGIRSSTPKNDELPESNSTVIETTVGRCIFDDILPAGMPFYNMTLNGKRLSQVISDCFEFTGSRETVDLLDRIKDVGFKYATLGGLSFGIMDLKIPARKSEIIGETEQKVSRIYKNYADGVLTEGERYNQVIDAWTNARVAVTNEMMRGLKEDTTEDGTPYLNPIYLMSDSGARGSVDQIQQLAGMRALMAKPSGEIIETPIKSNFREGLTVLEYFSSTHGARKGLADTALKTANSGYLTRKLIDVAQNLIITEHDCQTLQGITKSTVSRGEQIDVPLSQLIIGRTARDNIRNPITDEMVVHENEVITPEAAIKIEILGLDAIRVRSPLTCDSPYGICAKCYGWDMSTGQLVEEGSAVGIIAAQSIGEPGTQLTLRTFHTGGVAERAILEREQKATHAGKIQYRDINAVSFKRSDGSTQVVALKRNGEIALLDAKDRELDKFKVPYGATVLVEDGSKVKVSAVLFTWDPHRTPILAEVPGQIRFVDIIEGETIGIEEERKGQLGRPVVIEHKGDKHPQIIIEDTNGKILDVHYLPAGARIEVVEGQQVQAGQLLAHQPRATGGTQDITGGLPRVTEVFEARKPKDPAAMAEISGRVELRSDKRKGKMTIIIRSESGMEKEHHVPRDRHLNVHTADYAEAGDALTDGPLVPHDILRIKGEETLQKYLISEIQNVYRSQNVNINDKHVEIISAQMMRKVSIESVGDSSFLPGEVVDKFVFRRENERLAKSIRITNIGDSTDLEEGQIIDKKELGSINEKIEMIGGTPAKGRKPKAATAQTLLLGITKASLWSDSFIAAASFQETTKVLTEASLAGKIDNLHGLKENVILGHLIPAGTAFKPHLEIKVKHLAEAPLPKEFAEAKEEKEAEAKAEAAVKEALGIS